MSQTMENICRPNSFVVVLENIFFFFTKYLPFGVDFEICNVVDLFVPKHRHNTLTKIQKV